MRRTVDHIRKGLVAKFAGDPVNEGGAGMEVGIIIGNAAYVEGYQTIGTF
jgi:hypothetical protein